MSLARVPFPISTFSDIAKLGLILQVWCLGCKRWGLVDPTSSVVAERLFAGARFRCRCCGSLGAPSIVPVERVRPGTSIRYADVFCQRCVPPWELREVRFDRLPWSSIDIGCQRYRCLGCGGNVDWIWHGGVGVPFTDSFRRS